MGNLEMIVVLLLGMIVVHVIAMIEVAPVIVMIVVAPVISEDPGTIAGPETTVDLEISEDPEMTVDLEMIVVLVTGMIEVVIEEPMIGDPLPVFCLQQEMIDEMIAVIDEMIVVVIVEMIVVVIVEMILHRSRLPNVIKVGRKPPMVGMVGLQFLKNKNY